MAFSLKKVHNQRQSKRKKLTLHVSKRECWDEDSFGLGDGFRRKDESWRLAIGARQRVTISAELQSEHGERAGWGERKRNCWLVVGGPLLQHFRPVPLCNWAVLEFLSLSLFLSDRQIFKIRWVVECKKKNQMGSTCYKYVMAAVQQARMYLRP
jgi:hypothetical protein